MFLLCKVEDDKVFSGLIPRIRNQNSGQSRNKQNKFSIIYLFPYALLICWQSCYSILYAFLLLTWVVTAHHFLTQTLRQHKHILLGQACTFFLILVSMFFLFVFCHFLCVYSSLIVSLWVVKGNTSETSTIKN